jgi:hypothetical protein
MFDAPPLAPYPAPYLWDWLYDDAKKALLNSGRNAGADAEIMATLTSICDKRRIYIYTLDCSFPAFCCCLHK